MPALRFAQAFFSERGPFSMPESDDAPRDHRNATTA
jgi:hypothetical protein